MDKNQRIFLGIFAVIILVIIFASVWGRSGVNKDGYQTVFLTNGQVYFGKLEDEKSKYAKLTDVYYLRRNQQVQPQLDQAPQLSLIKLGDELHGPEDEMLINREHIVFWENLKENSRVVEIIQRHKTQGTLPSPLPEPIPQPSPPETQTEPMEIQAQPQR